MNLMDFAVTFDRRGQKLRSVLRVIETRLTICQVFRPEFDRGVFIRYIVAFEFLRKIGKESRLLVKDGIDRVPIEEIEKIQGVHRVIIHS